MCLRKNKIARKYFFDLIEFKNIENNICREIYDKTNKIEKEKFINNYPLSTLGIVNYRTF